MEKTIKGFAEAILAIHFDAGCDQGYIDGGYGFIDHCCIECGTFGEYGISWPCATARMAIEVLEELNEC